MTVVAVSDTGPLIHLAEIDALRLLSGLDRLYIPDTVYEELEAGGVPDGFQRIDYERASATTDDVTGDGLDPGETAAIAVAMDRDAVLLTDDLAAREYATDAGLDVHGTVGIIALGHNRGLVETEEAVSMMRALQRETSLFVSDAVIERGIELLEE